MLHHCETDLPWFQLDRFKSKLGSARSVSFLDVSVKKNQDIVSRFVSNAETKGNGKFTNVGVRVPSFGRKGGTKGSKLQKAGTLTDPLENGENHYLQNNNTLYFTIF